MRNIFQTQIDACQGHKGRLTGLKVFVAELSRSQYDALIEAPEASERRVQMDALKVEIHEALLQIDKLCGWA
jgi:hypothetical protein